MSWTIHFWADLFSRTSISPTESRETERLRRKGPSMIELSRKSMIIGTQSILNVLLASWLVNEYSHNRFMQDYLASTFSSIGLVLPVGIIIVAVAGGSLMVNSRRHQTATATETETVNHKPKELSAPVEKRVVTNTCPFCNLPLRNISGSRMQCRKCHRYFRRGVLQSLQKLSAQENF